MPILNDVLNRTQAAAVTEADARARGTVLDAAGNPVLAPQVAAVLDYANQLKEQLDSVLGNGVRRAGDPEAVPADLTHFYYWTVDVLYAGTQQLLLGHAQLSASMQVLSDSMSGSFAGLAPKLAQAQADATASLLNDQHLRADLTANGLADAAQASLLAAATLRIAAGETKQAATDIAIAAEQAQQQLTASRLAVVEQTQALAKTQADATAAGLALVQAQQTRDEAALATAQQQLTTLQGQASTTAQALVGLQAKVAADEQLLSTVQQAAATADAKAVAAQQRADTAQAKADADAVAVAAAQASADTAKTAAADAKATALAVGARFREVLGIAVPAISIGQTGQVTVSFDPPFADNKYGVHIQPETNGLLGLVGNPLSKTTSSCVLQLKSSLGLAVALGGTISVTAIHP